MTSHLNKLPRLLFVLLLVGFNALAQISSEDIAKDRSYFGAKISPDGKKIAIGLVDKGMRRLAVVDSGTFKPLGGANFGKKQGVGDFFWANNERLVMQVIVHEPWQQTPLFYGELYAVNYDGKKGQLIYGYRAGKSSLGSKLNRREATAGWAEIISLLHYDKKHILISSTPATIGGDRKATPHKLNIYSGKLSGAITGAPAPYTSYLTDKDGNLRLAVGYNRSAEKEVFSFNKIKSNWERIGSDYFGEAFTPLTIDNSGKYAYVIDDNNQDKEGLFKLNLATGEMKNFYTDKDVDITNVTFGTGNSGAYAVRIDPDYPTYLMFNSKTDEAKVYKKLLGVFPGYKVTITSRSEKGDLWMVYASNDISAGEYYLYNQVTNSFSKLFSEMKHINNDELSQSDPITFEASDKTKISGYITYPLSAKSDQKVPLVVLVHGGPHGPRDYWSFDREVHLLANLGYAVLRVNFRGSGGYGNKFLESGYKRWGDRIQQDIIDGTNWVIDQNKVNSDKICIMGGSFGAYSAVQSAILAPDLFKCVIANAGIYDLELLNDEYSGGAFNKVFGQSVMKKYIGTDPKQLKAFSPAHHVQKLKAPVLIAHGKKDRIAPIVHANILQKALDKHDKKYQLFIRNTEGHGFFDEENRIEYYHKIKTFLTEYL